MREDIHLIGIIGAGTMGSGIMINCVSHGFNVVLCDKDSKVLGNAKGRLDTYLTRQVEKGRMTSGDAKRTSARLTCVENVGALHNCDLVIEAVFEKLDLKKMIFAELEGVVQRNAVLASNTSCLLLADIADALEHQDRFCGMHYFSPAEINPIVELIEGPSTSQDVLSTAASFLNRTGKHAIPCKDQYGFALNRFFCPYSNEAVRLLDEGFGTCGQIDEVAMDTFGVAIGPFAVMNIIGTATTLHAVRNLEPLGPFYAAAKGLIANGADNTAWKLEEAPEAPDANLAKSIADRLTGAILLPVLEQLKEGCTSLDAIDRGAEMAFRFRKTPGILMKERGEEGVQRLIAKLAAQYRHDPTYVPAALA
ncbi:3-hydroxyacyl-CoA dehydrogenase family protein [Ruegeria sp. SCP11]|uniref:3-hydroxyacyl-CoA dehydrogenase family protein n=1 Tax=Ruegeria sp. SCP11 TaxID=3141378 RepID=UPI003336A1B1